MKASKAIENIIKKHGAIINLDEKPEIMIEILKGFGIKLKGEGKPLAASLGSVVGKTLKVLGVKKKKGNDKKKPAEKKPASPKAAAKKAAAPKKAASPKAATKKSSAKNTKPASVKANTNKRAAGSARRNTGGANAGKSDAAPETNTAAN